MPAGVVLVWTTVPFRVHRTVSGPPAASLTTTEMVATTPVDGAQPKVSGSLPQASVGIVPWIMTAVEHEFAQSLVLKTEAVTRFVAKVNVLARTTWLVMP